MAMMPYTHWAYFDTEEQAKACAKALGDCVIRIDPPRPVALHPVVGIELEGRKEWLLRAGRDVEIDDLGRRHDEVKAIVTAHGGRYDGGEATYMTTETGLHPTVDPAFDLTEDPRQAG